ncbi:hypothetical protein EMIT0P44_600007 [Pseudomonas sp. IT-P44]
MVDLRCQAYTFPVGASLLAMDVNDNAGCLNERVAQTLFAGKPAPTGIACAFDFHHSSGRALARLQLLIWTHRPLERPSGGSAQWATRHGCRVSRPRPWMADGGGPTEQDRSEGMPSLSEAPNERGKSAWLLGALPSDSL